MVLKLRLAWLPAGHRPGLDEPGEGCNLEESGGVSGAGPGWSLVILPRVVAPCSWGASHGPGGEMEFSTKSTRATFLPVPMLILTCEPVGGPHRPCVTNGEAEVWGSSSTSTPLQGGLSAPQCGPRCPSAAQDLCQEQSQHGFWALISAVWLWPLWVGDPSVPCVLFRRVRAPGSGEGMAVPGPCAPPSLPTPFQL